MCRITIEMQYEEKYCTGRFVHRRRAADRFASLAIFMRQATLFVQGSQFIGQRREDFVQNIFGLLLIGDIFYYGKSERLFFSSFQMSILTFN